MSETKLKYSQTVGNKYKLPCAGECDATTKHEVINSVQESGYVECGDYELDWCQKFEIVQCLGCEEISFRMESSNSEDIDHYTNKRFISETLYPRRDVNRAKIFPLPLFQCLPDNLSNIYRETNSAMDNELKVLSGIGMRAILETVCKNQKAKGNNLDEKIKSLVENGVLTESNAKTLHEVRALGNVSAHEVEPQPQAQLELAWDVIVNLLNNVYVIPARSKEVFKKK